MGLDNGIVIKNVDGVIEHPDWVKFPFENEVCYFRKYWNIRNEVMEKVHVVDNDCAKLDIEDIFVIRKIIMKFCNSEYWNENNDSIWEYDEALPNMIQNVLNLHWLESYMKEHPDAKVYWYDSY